MKKLIGHVNFLTGKFTPLKKKTAMQWIRETNPKPLDLTLPEAVLAYFATTESEYSSPWQTKLRERIKELCLKVPTT